jgi:hypothetical protein
MPLIEPVDLEECVSFLHQQRDDIRSGVYELKLKDAWVTKLNPSDLQFLLRHCESAKHVIAENTAEEKLLVSLASEHDPRVRAAVAGNPTTPSKILEKLSKDSVDYVRGAVAANSNTPESVLRILAMEEGFRGIVANNDNAPLDLIMRLPKGRWCDLCGRLCDRNDAWLHGNYTCHVCNRYYCKKHGQEVVQPGNYDSESCYWYRCIDHLKLRNKLGYYRWESLYAILFHGKPDREW